MVYEIPYRTLYNRKLHNVISAGRCISVDDGMWDISRVIPPCAVTGEAAGTAAALTTDFTELSYGRLAEMLKNSSSGQSTKKQKAKAGKSRLTWRLLVPAGPDLPLLSALCKMA